MEFYFDIKSRKYVEKENQYGFDKWAWPPVWSGKVEAEDSKKARLLIEEEYGRRFIMRDGVNVKEEPFLLSIKPMNEHLARRFELRKCEMCGNEYTLNDAYITGSGGRFCSEECTANYRTQEDLRRSEGNVDSMGYLNPPVIYRITNKHTGQCYIGKSIQSFTLRWWQHIKSGKGGVSETKFHDSMHNSNLCDWTYEVIEVIQYPPEVVVQLDKHRFILQREMHWINHYDSLRNGYNTLVSLKEDFDKYQLKLELE